MPYLPYEIFREWYRNKHTITAVLTGQTVERYGGKILGLDAKVFIALFVVHTILWLWAVTELMIHIKYMSKSSKVFATVLLLLNLPVGTLVVIHLSKQT